MTDARRERIERILTELLCWHLPKDGVCSRTEIINATNQILAVVGEEQEKCTCCIGQTPSGTNYIADGDFSCPVHFPNPKPAKIEELSLAGKTIQVNAIKDGEYIFEMYNKLNELIRRVNEI